MADDDQRAPIEDRIPVREPWQNVRCTCGTKTMQILYHATHCDRRIVWEETAMDQGREAAEAMVRAVTGGGAKYGSVEAFGAKLHPDEPWFAIRAQDVLAPQAVAAYADYLRKLGLDEQAAHVDGLGQRMLTWQAANRNLVKRPD